jgi:hypothetical protein
MNAHALALDRAATAQKITGESDKKQKRFFQIFRASSLTKTGVCAVDPRCSHEASVGLLHSENSWSRQAA